tara:strand:+ start:302 stop:1018 length:717 start_codon:yes stop_codon:yes gene_type:complete
MKSSSEDTGSPTNIQKVNVSVDSSTDDGYGYGCGNGYCDDGYLGPGGFIYRYPPPWNYMDSINPGFYYPESSQYIPPYLSNYCGDMSDVAGGSVPITNSIKIFSDNNQTPSLEDDTSQKNVSRPTLNVSEYPVPSTQSEEYAEKKPIQDHLEKQGKYGSERTVPSERTGCGKDDVDKEKSDSLVEQSSNVNKDMEKFPSEPVECGSNSTVITTVIVLGIIILIAIVLAFVFIKRSRRD